MLPLAKASRAYYAGSSTGRARRQCPITRHFSRPVTSCFARPSPMDGWKNCAMCSRPG
ncbi:hypothetical protein AWT69_003148 [Pseudomonas putida]|nr:hypothetical protein AWT69_003148 [Pseudomonas putida]